MWTTDKTRRARISPRPLRVAYLVPSNPDHTLLDTIFDESMSRWGGRRTPVIITDGATIRDVEWTLLDLWDADIIYSYVTLEDQLHDRIAYCLSPYSIKVHPAVDELNDHRSYRPEADELRWALKSVSVLPQISRNQEIGGGSTILALDKERGSELGRDLIDSFGFLSNSMVDIRLSPYAKRLSFRQRGNERYAPRFNGDDVISYISDVEELENRLASDRQIHVPAQMSDMFCPYLNILQEYDTSWEEQLTIVVGDCAEDRILFWNAIHRYASLDTFRSNQIFRFDKSRFQHGLPPWIEQLCSGATNMRRLRGNGASHIRIVSSSVDAEQLKTISNNIKNSGHVMSSSDKMAAPDVFEPLSKTNPRTKYRHSHFLWQAWSWQHYRNTATVRIEQNEVDLPCTKPKHTEEFPLSPVTVGAWFCDLSIERTEDHSRFSNIIHRWMFPRRLALHNAIEVENHGQRHMALRPTLRPTERGELCLWDDPQWRRPVIRIPQDIDAFCRALRMQHPNTKAEYKSHHGKLPYARIDSVTVSDKGRDLLGVLKFFGNLHEAICFLTNPYLLLLISKLITVTVY